MRPGDLLVVLALGVALGACGGGATAGPTSPPAKPAIGNTPGPELAAGECRDPIAGTWRARVFRAEVGKVDEVTLTLTRVGITELRGTIVVASWDADHQDAEALACLDGMPAVNRVVQTATGWARGTEVDIAGSDPERTEFACGLVTGGTYNPDHFTGELDDSGRTLVTTNTDGGSDNGRPHVFERQSCRSP